MATSDIKKGPLYVDSTNNRVGVGTSSPTASLTVGAASNEGTLRIGDNGTYYGEIKRINTSDELRIGHYGASQKLTFHTVNAERMRIDSAGRISINTTAATELLNVAASAGNGAGIEFAGNGTTVGSTSAFYGQGSGSDAYVWNRANNPILFGTNNAEKMRIDSSGRVTMPYQPAWHLQPSWTSNTTPSTNSIIPFGVYGGHGTFATSVTVSSGRVTVPVSGKYWIASTMRQENSQTDYQISLRKNGYQIIRSGIWYSSQAYENLHLMGMVNLAANDYLEIDINSSNMPPINGYNDTLTFFSGYLVG